MVEGGLVPLFCFILFWRYDGRGMSLDGSDYGDAVILVTGQLRFNGQVNIDCSKWLMKCLVDIFKSQYETKNYRVVKVGAMTANQRRKVRWLNGQIHCSSC